MLQYGELQQNKIFVLYVIQTIHLKCPSLSYTIAAKQTCIKNKNKEFIFLSKRILRREMQHYKNKIEL